MRKKLINLFFCFLIGIVLMAGVNFSSGSAYADSSAVPIYEYIISNQVSGSSNVVLIQSKMSDGSTEDLGIASTFNLAMDYIKTHLDGREEINIYFDNFETTAVIELAESKYVLSGKITSVIEEEIIKINPKTTANVTFNNFSITAHNSSCLIQVETDKTTSITFNNLTATSSLIDSYVLKSTNQNLSIILKSELKIQTENFVDICMGNTLTFDSSASILSADNLNVSVPYSQTSFTPVLNVSSEIFNKLSLISNSDYYQVNAVLDEGSVTVSTSLVPLTITFDMGDGTTVTRTGTYGQTINYPTATKTNHAFKGWFLDNTSFVNEYSQTTFERNLTLYAKFNPYVTIYFYTNDGFFSAISGEANLPITRTIPTPTRSGYDFSGWKNKLTDEKWTNFDYYPTQSVSLIATWRVRQYNLTIVTHISQIETKTITFGNTFELPTLSRENYRFNGWFEDADNTIEFTLQTMPARNLTIYAQWIEKETINISTEIQTFEFDERKHSFVVYSTLNNFKVEYLIDGKWSEESPIDAGKYDVRLSRSEDSVYKKLELVISDGLTINPISKNMMWLVFVLFVVGVAEIAIGLLFMYMKKLKRSKYFSVVPMMFVLSNYQVASNQITLLVVSGIIAVLGLVFMIYEFVTESRTNPLTDFGKSEYDNRKHLQKIGDDDDNFFTTSAINADDDGDKESYKYSANDIEQMLLDPNYFDKQKPKQNSPNQSNPSVDDLSDAVNNDEDEIS